MSGPRLVLTDGTTTINLLGSAFGLREWLPAVAGYKGGGVIAVSPLADGSRLVDRHFENVVESFDLVVRDTSADNLIYQLQQLRRLLEKAADYWASEWTTEPVWLEAQARDESGTRYAVVHQGRIEADGNPFSQPFLQPDCRAVMDGLTLLIERGHWQDVAIGQNTTCADILVGEDLAVDPYINKILALKPIALWPFNEGSGATAKNYSTYGLAGNLDGVYNSVMWDANFFPTYEDAVFVNIATGSIDLMGLDTLAGLFDGDEGAAIVWLRTSGLIWNDGNDHFILQLQADASNTIQVYKTTTDAQLRVSRFTGGKEVTFTYTLPNSGGVATTEWFNVCLTWSLTAGRLDLYVSGVLVAGEDIRGTAPFSGSLDGSATIAGASDLTGSDSISANMAYCALFNYPLTPAQVALLTSQPLNTELDSLDCRAFATNKYTQAKLSHVYYYDNSLGSFSSNLLYETPSFEILPGSPAAGDRINFGIDTAANPNPSGPFASLIFDLIGEQQTGSWQYWNGAWAALTVQDGTDSFKKNGVHSVNWFQPADWATTAVNGVTGYWVRFLLSGGASSPPKQQNRKIYTAINPYVDIPAASIGGDLPALIRLWALIDKITGTTGTTGYYSRLLAGLRSVERGESFSAYLNLADKQNPSGVTVSLTSMAFADSLLAPSGRRVEFTGTGQATATIAIAGPFSGQYFGRFHLYLRANANGGSTGDCTVRISVQNPAGGGTVYTTAAAVDIDDATTDYQAYDMGIINIAQAGAPPYGDIYLTIVATSTGTDLYLYDLILIPVDEWAGDFYLPTNTLGGIVTLAESLLDVDSLSQPKDRLSASHRNGTLLRLARYVAAASARPATVQANKHQRLWLFHYEEYDTATTDRVSYPFLQNRVRLYRAQRYLSARGSR